jgi:hypothetical protein
MDAEPLLGGLGPYSTSASSSGSTQMPLCAMRFAYGCVLRLRGVSRLRNSAADVLLKPCSTLPHKPQFFPSQRLETTTAIAREQER